MATITADNILDLVAEEAPVAREDLKPEATLDALGVASLDVISVLFAIEDRFGVVVEQADVEGVTTLQSFIDAVLAKAKATT